MHPRSQYNSRRDRWQTEETTLEKQFIRISNYRLAIGIIAAFLAWLAFWRGLIAGWWLFVPLVVFIGLVVWHQRVIRRRTLARRAIQYYDLGLARLDDHWAGAGNPGESFRDANHIYADDLDVFGKGSLFELIACTRTAAGDQKLATWFLSAATPEELLLRQDAVRELSTRLDLREDIALLGEDMRVGAQAESLERWGSAPPVGFAPFLRPLALIMAVAGITAFVLFFANVLPLSPFAAILGFNFVFIVIVRKRVAQVIESVDTPGSDLRILSLILERLERESFETVLLKELRSRLNVRGVPASKRIARLERWVELLDSSDHLFVRVIRPIVLWNEQAAMAVEAWRRQTGHCVGDWLSAVAEFEALSSLASLAFERPDWTFPVLVEGSEPEFEASALQHPLLPASRCVPNNLQIGGDLRLLIVSGSNMSGKSTLLRAIGLNTVLAWAGAPVAAKELRISAFQLGTSIRITDSLQDGRSRFMAEITRIRQIVDLTAGQCPVLFLLDELLSGTNSHDRRIGAAAIVKGLIERAAIGLITTHDLALANLEQDLGARAINVHFEDKIIDGRIEFDYHLRPGIVEHSNALELMRAVGLQV